VPDLLLILIVILVAVIFWRGPKNLPKIGETLGRGVREARREAGEITRDKDSETPPDHRASQ
jgi:Sec-independent protein translocase protein TatA